MLGRVQSVASLLMLAAVLCLPGLSALAYTITLNANSGSYLRTTTSDKVGSGASETVFPTMLPYSYTSTSVDGNASSKSVYALNYSGFDIALDHSRAATYQSFGQSYGSIHFSVNQNIGYVASGSYSAIDSDGLRLYFDAHLLDITVGSYAFQSTQRSDATLNENFTLGGTGGDTYNYSTGLLAGTLIAGHDYEFFYNSHTHGVPSVPTSGATATGSVSLSFIPEPATGLLLLAGSLSLVGWRRRLH